MPINRTDRLNSLLKEVISEVIRKNVRNPDVQELVTVTRVNISKDLHHAKVYISIIGKPEEKWKTLKALKSAAGFISINASKKVVMRFFPELKFILDDSADRHMRIEQLLGEIKTEQNAREQDDT